MVRRHPARGLWEARYTGADGRRHSLYAKTRKGAQERLRAALTDADHGIRPVANRLTVGEYLNDWLTGLVRLQCRPRTADSYAETVDRYINPAIGKVPLTKLTPEHVARMLADLTTMTSKRGRLSPTTVRYAYTVLRIALGRALKSGRVLRNVATLATPPPRARLERHPLSADQARAFVAATSGDRLGPLYVVAIGTGMREGELLALRWVDVDLEAGTLTVRHTLSVGTRELAEPKTERARRTLRLGTEVAGALREQRRRQRTERVAAGSRWFDHDFVFASPIGTPLDASNVLHALQTALAAAGLPRQRFHDLRHAFATLMIESGEDIAVISKILGHATLATTADIYAHLTPATSQRVADRMDAILRPAAGG
jgi:integrase